MWIQHEDSDEEYEEDKEHEEDDEYYECDTRVCTGYGKRCE